MAVNDDILVSHYRAQLVRAAALDPPTVLDLGMCVSASEYVVEPNGFTRTAGRIDEFIPFSYRVDLVHNRTGMMIRTNFAPNKDRGLVLAYGEVMHFGTVFSTSPEKLAGEEPPVDDFYGGIGDPHTDVAEQVKAAVSALTSWGQRP
jgi:hypothetical protein